MGRYQFGRFVVDEHAGALLCEGEPVHLQPKVYQLLLFLVRRPGVLFSRELLSEELWPGVFVTEDSLTQVVRKLRLALGADETLLETVPRRGYKLNTPAPHAMEDPSLVGRAEHVRELRERMAAARYTITLHGPGGTRPEG